MKSYAYGYRFVREISLTGEFELPFIGKNVQLQDYSKFETQTIIAIAGASDEPQKVTDH